MLTALVIVIAMEFLILLLELVKWVDEEEK